LPEAIELGDGDVDEMLDLIGRTRPGPFLRRTNHLGRYVGIRRDGALIAMAGERTQPPGFTEISAVCTDPAFQRQGLAAALVRDVAHTIRGSAGHIGAKALTAGGRWAVLDLKVPGKTPGWLARLGTATVRPFASIDQWIMRRPWETIRTAMQEELADPSWTELFFGTAFLAAGSRDRSISTDTDSPSASAEVGG
jgi:demethylmenaquinone methyltransferase/2-methoxy-6-polyprenyl-1,4-benzoquinol methylase